MSKRNYGAMGNEKLLREAASVPPEDVQKVQAIIDERGLAGSAYSAPSTPKAEKIKPMLASKGTKIPVGEDWVMQPKFDGWRMIAIKGEAFVCLFSRTMKQIDSIPYINNELNTLLPPYTIVDGEIVDLSGGAQWNRTQTICSRYAEHRPTDEDPPLTYVLFDLLQLEGTSHIQSKQSLRELKLKQLIDVAAAQDGNIKRASSLSSTEANYQRFLNEGHEGAICRNLDARYKEGRSKDLLKFKPVDTTEAILTGTYEAEPGKYSGIAVGGITFEYGGGIRGKAAGMNDQLRKELYVNPGEFTGRIVEIAHQGVGEDGALRFPRFKRFRDSADKGKDEV